MADRVQRKMAVILAADVAGYSRLIGEDEEGTLATFRTYRELVDRLIGRHEGRVFGSAGDSVVAEFASPVEAVRCATEIQIELARRNADFPDASQLRFRIGINLGDVVIEGDNLMGDGVNVAARLEAMARPGGICVSETVYAQARDRLSLNFVDLGEHRLKNIARPIRAYRVPLSSEEQVKSPFRGLEVFEFENADLFFGRTRAIAACTERLQQLAAGGKAFLLIYGMSGSGKSSLLRAGLLPSITRAGPVAGIGAWRRCLIRPSEGPDAVAALTTALFREGALPELAAEVDVVEFTLLGWNAPDRALALIRHALVKAAGNAGAARSQARLLVAVDQLEELFTTEKQAPAREALVRLMATLAASGLVWLIATIRSDFFHRCGEVPGFSALKDGLASYELLPPTGPEIAQIIREPARASGLRFEESPDQGRLDDVLQEAAAADPGSLPLLEFVLDALYEAARESRVLTFAQYRALGGLEGAIARRADEVVEALPPEIQEALPAVLRALTTVRPGDEKATARPVAEGEIAAMPTRRALVEALVASRLLVSDEDVTGHVFVRLAHEALLFRWPRAAEIVNANRNFLETRARLKADAQRWLSDNRNTELLLPSGKRLAEGEELLPSRREEVGDQIAEYIEASSREQQEREEKNRRAERALIEAAEAAKLERLEHEADRLAGEAERRDIAAAAAIKLARRTRYAAVVAALLALVAGVGAFVGFRGQQEATNHADEALRSQSLALSFLSQHAAERGDTEAAILLALEVLPAKTSTIERPYVVEAEAALYQALLAHHQARVFKHQAAVTDAMFNHTGDRIVTSSYDKTARIWDASNGTETAVLIGHEGVVERAEFSPDGSRVLTAARDGTARIWDATSRKQLSVLQPVGDFPTAIFSPSGKQVLTAGDVTAVSLWDADTGAKLFSEDAGGYAATATFSPDGASFASYKGYIGNATSDFVVSIRSVADGTLKQALRVSTWPSSLAFSPDGTRILVGARAPITTGSLSRLFDISKGTEIATLAGQKSDTQLKGIIFSHDGSRIAMASIDGSAKLWDGISGKLLNALGQESMGLKLADIAADERDREINSAFSHDDRYLATTSLDHVVRIWDVDHTSLVTTIRGHTGLVEHVEFSPTDNNILLTASHDGTTRLWDVDGALTTDLVHDDLPSFAALSPDNVHVLTGGGDAAAHLWDISAGREIARLDTQEAVNHATFSPDGRRVATASKFGNVIIWDVASRRETVRFKSGVGLREIQFSPKGDLLDLGTIDGNAELRDAASGTRLTVFKTSSALAHAVFSPDGQVILTATSDNVAHLLKLDGTELKSLAGHESRISAADFSPDGQFVATASLDRTARIWSVKDGTRVATLRGHGDEVTIVSFSRDGQSLITAARDGTVRIWGVSDWKQRAVLRAHSGEVGSARFSPNGSYVVTASRKDRTVRLWATQSGREIAVLASPSEEVVRPALTKAAFSADGTRIIIVSGLENPRIIRVFPTLQELIDFARSVVPRELTPCERQRYFLAIEGGAGDCPG